MSNFASRECIPCRGDMLRLQGDALEAFVPALGDGWRVVEGHHLEKEYRFKNFQDALAFTVHVGELAEREGHHPDIHLSWGRVRLLIWTHKISGLTENDFIFAAKADERLSSVLANRASAAIGP